MSIRRSIEKYLVYPLKLTLLKDIVNMCIKHSDTLVCRVESKGFLQENVVVAYALMQMRGLTLEEKSWRIWKYVPVLPPVGSIPYITKTEPLSQIQASMEEMYNQAAEQFVRYSWCRNDLVVVI